MKEMKYVRVCVVLVTVVWMCESVTVYKMLSGYSITSPVLSTRSCDKFCRRTCLMACGCESGCKSVSVSQPLQVCQLHQNVIYDEETEFAANSQFEYHQISTDTVKKGDWTLVFRITPYTGLSALTTWQNSGNHDDHPANKDGVPPGCASINSSKSCDRNFRSKILDDWESFNIQQVKLEIFKDGVSKHKVVFDGSGSDVNSWMTQDRIISTTWADLEGSTTNYFGITGHGSRNFDINKAYAGCPGDTGWLVVINAPGGFGCGWEARSTTIPTIFYASGNTSTLSDNYDLADVLAVMVKLG